MVPDHGGRRFDTGSLMKLQLLAGQPSRTQRTAANRKAMRAFHASFPVPCKIEIAQVWQCQRV